MLKRMLGNCKGQSMVEFALILPVLILILVAIIEFGLIFKTVIQLDYGANAISRAISLDATPAEVTQLSSTIFSDLVITNLDVSMTPITAVKGQPITVKITYNYKFMTPVIGNLLGNTVVLKGTSVIIKE